MTATMTSRERILAAIRREPVDRIPVSPRLNLSIPAFGYQSSGVANMVDLKRRFPYDPHEPFGFVHNHAIFGSAFPSITYTEGVDMRIEVRDQGDTLRITSTFDTPAGPLRQVRVTPKPGRGGYGLNPDPHIAEHMIKEKTDVERVRYLLPPPATFSMGEFFAIERAFWDEAVPMMYILGPMDHTGGNLCEMTELMMAYYENRAFFDAVLALFTDFSMSQLRYAIEQGVKHFFLVYFYASLSSGWSPAIYREVFVPVIKRQAEMIHDAGGVACLYDDGKLMDSLPMIVETGVDCVETCTPAPMGDFDIAVAKQQYGNRLAFKGGIDIVNVLWRGTPELIDERMREYMEIGAAGSGLLIGTCDTIRPETPTENVQAFFNSANKYARVFAPLTRG